MPDSKKTIWNLKNVMEKAGLKTDKSIHGIEYGETSLRVELLIDDLIKVSKALENPKFTNAEYEEYGEFGSATVIKKFGGWNKAKLKAGLQIGGNYNTTIEEYMQNILTLWTHYGIQPKYSEVMRPISKYNVSSYENKFGTWKKSLIAFIEYMNEEQPDSESTTDDNELVQLTENVSSKKQKKKEIKVKRAPRQINLRLRWKILKRDNFSCNKCGNSPSKDLNVELHVDHIIPWSNGGETDFENLETLCSDCNLGKSNLM